MTDIAMAAKTKPGGGDFPSVTPAAVRETLLAHCEILLADVREEDPYAQGHPLWAANFPLGRLEVDAFRRIPRREAPIVLYGHDGRRDLAPIAGAVLRRLGYTNISLLEGGLARWKAEGYEIFIDVNVPSKAFGELVEARRHTPLLAAEEVRRMLASERPPVVLDARRFDEYAAMCIPTGISVPGAELVLRVRDLAPDPETQVIVNCAGRTRSIIGTQSLINAGIPNPVAGLRNGTIGWTLVGLTLENGASRRCGKTAASTRAQAAVDARAVAERAGVRRISLAEAQALGGQERSVYRIDVRSVEEYRAGHLPGFVNAPGGQLVQEADHTIPVRGALVLLADDDGARADMTGSWLAQMGWEVHVLDPVSEAQRSETGDVTGMPEDIIPAAEEVRSAELDAWLGDERRQTAVIDVSTSAAYVGGHLPGAWFVLRSQLPEAIRVIGRADRYVVTGPTEAAAALTAAELTELAAAPVFVLAGGLAEWRAAGLPVAVGEERLASPRIDRYRRPYEGTDVPQTAMEAYLEWEYGLVAQLDRDGTHFFDVI